MKFDPGKLVSLPKLVQFTVPENRVQLGSIQPRNHTSTKLALHADLGENDSTWSVSEHKARYIIYLLLCTCLSLLKAVATAPKQFVVSILVNGGA